MASVPRGSDSPSAPAPRLYGPDGQTVRILRADTGGAVPAVPAPAEPAATLPPPPSDPHVDVAPTASKTPVRRRPRKAPASAPQTAPAPHAPSIEGRVRERMDHAKEWLEAAAIEIRGASALMFIWRKLGLKGLFLVLLVLGGPIGEYSVFSRFVNATLPRMAGNFGVQFEAEEWSYHPFALKAIARNVKIRPEHDKNAAPVFTAAEVEFQGTIGTVGSGILEFFTGRWVHTFNEIDIRHAHLQLERSMTGNLNWDEYVEAVPAARRSEIAGGGYRINGVSVEDLKITYLEHLAGQSGAGIIETVQANIFIDAIRGSVTSIKPLEGSSELPTRISFDGRSAEGTIEVRGKLGLQPSRPGGSPDAGEPLKVSTGAEPAASGPLYDVTIALSNVGMGAYATMVPATRVVPSRGNLHGRIRLVNIPSTSTPPCFSDLRATDVRYAPNPRIVTRPVEFEALRQDTSSFSASGPFDLCKTVMPTDHGKPAGDDPIRRVTSATILASFNEQTTTGAPRALRQAVALDTQRTTGGSLADAAFDDVTAKLADRAGQKLSQVLGPQAGAALRQSVPRAGAARGQESSSVSKGVKGVGRSIKRLFGGGKKPDK